MSDQSEPTASFLRGTWTAGTLAGLAGLAQPTLATWRKRYGLKLTGDKQGGWARFVFADFVMVWLVRKLVDLDVGATKACTIANEIADQLGELVDHFIENIEASDELPQEDAPYLFAYDPLVWDGVAFEICKSLGSLIDAISTNSTKPCLVIGLGAIVRRVALLLHHHTRTIDEVHNHELPFEERAKIAWRNPEIRDEFRNDFPTYKAYLITFETGRVRHE